jgi:hypothetical protein
MDSNKLVKDVVILSAHLHREALNLLVEATGLPLRGLGSGCAHLGISSTMKKKLRNIDTVVGWVEKLSLPLIEQFLRELGAELAAAAHIDKHGLDKNKVDLKYPDSRTLLDNNFQKVACTLPDDNFQKDACTLPENYIHEDACSLSGNNLQMDAHTLPDNKLQKAACAPSDNYTQEDTCLLSDNNFQMDALALLDYNLQKDAYTLPDNYIQEDARSFSDNNFQKDAFTLPDEKFQKDAYTLPDNYSQEDAYSLSDNNFQMDSHTPPDNDAHTQRQLHGDVSIAPHNRDSRGSTAPSATSGLTSSVHCDSLAADSDLHVRAPGRHVEFDQCHSHGESVVPLSELTDLIAQLQAQNVRMQAFSPTHNSLAETLFEVPPQVEDELWQQLLKVSSLDEELQPTHADHAQCQLQSHSRSLHEVLRRFAAAFDAAVQQHAIFDEPPDMLVTSDLWDFEFYAD